MAIIEKKIEVMILSIHSDPFLAFEKCKADTQFENEGLNLAQYCGLDVLFRVAIPQAQKIGCRTK